MHATSPTHPMAPARRGSVYILVLGLVMLMVLTGTGAVLAARARAGAIANGNDTMSASVLAESAVEFALTAISTDSAWRTTYTSGVEASKAVLGNGTISFKLVDEVDGNLANNTSDPVRIYGYGRVGSATQAFSVVASGTDPLSCLNAPLVVNGNLNFNRSTVNATGMTLVSNANVDVGSSGPGATVKGNVEAAGTITLGGGTISGSQKSGASVTKRDMPKTSVFDPYIAAGTVIPYSSLPTYSGGGRVIQDVLIAPTSNPYNILATNGLGVYVIDCGGRQITILRTRIVGTLVILNPGAGSSIGADGVNDELSWVAAVGNYPCLLVKGDMKIAYGASSSSQLRDSGLISFSATVPYPYPSGTTNLLGTSSYPSRIQGLVYVSGNVVGSQSGAGTYSRVDTLIVGGTFDASQDKLYPAYTAMYLTYPPPGFTGSGTPKPQPGTWRREAMP